MCSNLAYFWDPGLTQNGGSTFVELTQLLLCRVGEVQGALRSIGPRTTARAAGAQARGGEAGRRARPHGPWPASGRRRRGRGRGASYLPSSVEPRTEQLGRCGQYTLMNTTYTPSRHDHRARTSVGRTGWTGTRSPRTAHPHAAEYPARVSCLDLGTHICALWDAALSTHRTPPRGRIPGPCRA